jgi:hypothetical protein
MLMNAYRQPVMIVMASMQLDPVDPPPLWAA